MAPCKGQVCATFNPWQSLVAVRAQEAEFRKRELSLKQRDIELQESLVRFSKFLQESDAKRIRATKKVAEERRLREEKTREAEILVSSRRSISDQKQVH